jgi:hypothetical protein
VTAIGDSARLEIVSAERALQAIGAALFDPDGTLADRARDAPLARAITWVELTDVYFVRAALERALTAQRLQGA